MAPKKKQRVQVDESDLSASEDHEGKSSEPVPPISITKDLGANLLHVKPEWQNLRRKTRVLHRAGTPGENDQVETPDAEDDQSRPSTSAVTPLPHGPTDSPLREWNNLIANFLSMKPEWQNLRRKTHVLHSEGTPGENDQVETPDASDDQNRPSTSAVTPFPHGSTHSTLGECNPGTEMSHSEMEKTEIQSQLPTLQDSKPKKRGRKKKTLPALQEDSVMEMDNADDKKESLVSSAPTSGPPKKYAKKKSARSKDATPATAAAQRKRRPERHIAVEGRSKRKH